MSEVGKRGVDNNIGRRRGGNEGVVCELADSEVFGMFLLQVAVGVIRPVGRGQRRRTVLGGEREALLV